MKKLNESKQFECLSAALREIEAILDKYDVDSSFVVMCKKNAYNGAVSGYTKDIAQAINRGLENNEYVQDILVRLVELNK